MFFEVFNVMLFRQFWVNLSDALLASFLARFLTRFLARVLTRVSGRGKTINTVYSATRPEGKQVKTKTSRTITP